MQFFKIVDLTEREVDDVHVLFGHHMALVNAAGPSAQSLQYSEQLGRVSAK